MAIVIWSFTRGDGVLAVTLPRWAAYAESIGVKLYVATDSHSLEYPYKIMYSRSDWKQEWSDVIDALKRKNVKYFISILDDFYLFNGPNEEYLLYLHDVMRDNNVDYVALEPHPAKNNLLDKMASNDSIGLKQIGCRDRYPSSLRPSIWSLRLFEETVQAAHNIWDFETVFIEQYKYLTVTNGDYTMTVKHLLEKGKINYNIIHLDTTDRRKLLNTYQYDYYQILKIPKILISNITLRLVGFRVHNVFNKHSNTRI